MRMWRRQHRGRPLSDSELRLYRPHFPAEVLAAARIFDGRVPFWLRPAMEAVVLGRRIHFRAGAYLPGTLRGIELLAHELVHVQQFLEGMTVFGYLWQSRRDYRRNRYEVEARTKAAEVVRGCGGATAVDRLRS